MKIGFMLIIAFMLDLILKNKKIFHLKKLINNFIKYLEIFIRRIFRNGKAAETIAGVVMVVIIMGLSFFVPFTILSLCYYVDTVLGIIVEVILCFHILGLGSLKEYIMKIYSELYTENIGKAGRMLSDLADIDTEGMDEKEIVRSSVEYLSKNTNDRVTAPLFYMIIGGASLGLVYKAVNNLDALIGKRTKKYLYFGMPAAKLDDILNIIPARITGFLYVAAAFLSGFDYKLSYDILLRDRWNHDSPNSGYPEAALAGALGIQLGGRISRYGEMCGGKYIGDDIKEPDIEDIPKSCMLMTIVSVLALILLILAKFAVLFIADYGA